MNKSSKGFSIVWMLLIIVVLAGIGLVGWRIANRQKEQSSKPARKPFEAVNRPIKKEVWLTYKNEEVGITFQHPESWTNTVNNDLMDDGKLAGVSGSVTSPQSNELSWNYIDPAYGGGGGYCPTNPGDQPFAIGNNCGTKQILGVEKIPSVKTLTDAPFNAFKDRLFITRTKYMAPDSNGEITYQICLDSYYARDEIPKESVKIDDLLFPCDFWRNGFNVKFGVKNEAAFNSSEAATAERIMKSFDSL